MDDHHEQRFKELTERAWALGYRLVKRNHEDDQAGIRDYLLWGVHQRTPLVVTHTAATLDGNGSIAAMLDGISELPRYCLQLLDNPGIEVVTNTSGRRIVRDAATRDFFMLLPGEHEGATQLTVHVEYPPSIGNWSRAGD